jgi:catechol 2,3-dioxygenase-like lactoylglutathione lyase family enzyme
MRQPAFSHLFVHVADLARTRDFYVGRLGLEVLAEEPGYLRIGGSDGFSLGLEERGHEEIGARGIELEIQVADVDALAGDLRAGGIEVTEPSEQGWGARHAWLHDPDGYRLSIFTSSRRDA